MLIGSTIPGLDLYFHRGALFGYSQTARPPPELLGLLAPLPAGDPSAVSAGLLMRAPPAAAAVQAPLPPQSSPFPQQPVISAEQDDKALFEQMHAYLNDNQDILKTYFEHRDKDKNGEFMVAARGCQSLSKMGGENEYHFLCWVVKLVTSIVHCHIHRRTQPDLVILQLVPA